MIGGYEMNTFRGLPHIRQNSRRAPNWLADMALEEQRDDVALVADAHDRSLDARQAGLSTTAPLSFDINAGDDNEKRCPECGRFLDTGHCFACNPC
jgi:hypothetical protein